MCGIAGVINKRGEYASKALVKQMCDVITHRGPDEYGIFQKKHVGLGMRRLSIIDLATGKQPITNENKSIWIVFNGEIYNHQDLRLELEKKGHRFKTKADTEAIIHAYEEWGEDCVTRLNGMFAIAIWDSKRQRLFLARDRIGIKPLYYYSDQQKLVFGSEIKSILQVPGVQRELNLQALDNFLTFEYTPGPRSIFKNIQKLSPGHWLIYEKGNLKIKRYWDFSFKYSGVSENEIIGNFRDLLEDAVKIRLMSDVPLGSLLSGGLDSSTIVSLMCRSSNRPVKTFSIGFTEGSYNELDHARTIANHFKTEHYEYIISPEIVDLTEKLLGYFDEPFGDFSIFPTYWVSKIAREHVTVVLSGDGGDELLGGYDTYIADKLARPFRFLSPVLQKQLTQSFIQKIRPTEKKKGFINRVKRFSEGMQYPADLQHVRWMIFLSEADKEKLYTKELQSSLVDYNPYDFIQSYFTRSRNGTGARKPLEQQQYVDIMSYLVDDILVKVDRMSMATSLEARVPFLDHRFVEFVGTIPEDLKIRGKETKYILRRAMQDILPESIMRRGKEGFSIPIKNWLKKELKPLMLETLTESKIRESGLFKPKFVNKLINEHLSGAENHSHRLWALVMFNLWYSKYMG